MARGWESKSVESQIEERRSHDGGGRERLSAGERERRSKRESLEMSRRGVVAELQSAHSELRRASLQKALAFLDNELKKFE